MLIKAAALVFIWIFILGCGASAQESGPSEYQIKAAFLYHFAQYVEWPPQAFASPKSPFVIGMLGKNVFGGDLEQTLRNKTINNHPFEFKQFNSVNEAVHCQILFISPSETDQWPTILEGLASDSVLTVSKTDHFTDTGGMINFIIENDRGHFQINNEAAKKTGPRISSRLLRLASSRTGIASIGPERSTKGDALY